MPSTALPLADGSRGEAVRDLQRRLDAGQFDHAGDESGTYGAATEAAVRRFQAARGLAADGICGQQTWSAVVEAGYRPGDRLLYHRTPMLRGDDVAELQRLLGGLGFFADRIDGIFGPRTAVATQDFQRNAGLTSDGICGPATVASLRRMGDRPAQVKAGLLDREHLRTAPRLLHGQRVLVGDTGGLASLAAAVGRSLHEHGALVEVCAHPDQSAQAAEANDISADVYLGLRLVEAGACRCSYYGRPDYESVGGRRLAERIAAAVAPALGLEHGNAVAMRLPVLRETRMVAVLCDLGSPSTVVEQSAGVATQIAAALTDWAADPMDE